ncbi:TPA: hypothetical protein DIC38_03320 [Candidatus Nomurabacteria bacterium]|nr:MAG: hypothetical protein O210_OD1C00001G0122 [Parcubacteria bacterium RAAC4_OD1_1]HCY26680.1 hypothetical protein [Candidatus Nomurabacteria bacterium]
MKEFKKGNNIFYHNPIFLFVLFLFLLLLFYKVFGLIQKEKESSKNKELLLSQVEDLKKRENNLSLEISSLETEEGVEKLIRDKYQVAKEGEKMVIIVGEDNIEKESKNKNNNGFLFWVRNIFDFNK